MPILTTSQNVLGNQPGLGGLTPEQLQILQNQRQQVSNTSVPGPVGQANMPQILKQQAVDQLNAPQQTPIMNPAAQELQGPNPAQIAGGVTGSVGGHALLNAGANALSSSTPAAAPAALSTPFEVNAAGQIVAPGAAAPAAGTAAGSSAIGAFAAANPALAIPAAAAGELALNEFAFKPAGKAVLGDKFDNAGANIGNLILPGGPGALAGGAIGGLFGGKKGKDQKRRDGLRDNLEESGFAFKGLDGSHRIELADGSLFNIGLDGGARITNDKGEKRQVFDVDLSDPEARNVVGLVNPLATVVVGGDGKLRSDFAGYLTNASLSSGDTVANIRKFYLGLLKDKEGNPITDVGQARDIYRNQIEKLRNDKTISDGEADAAAASLDRLFLTNDPLTAPGSEGGGTPVIPAVDEKRLV